MNQVFHDVHASTVNRFAHTQKAALESIGEFGFGGYLCPWALNTTKNTQPRSYQKTLPPKRRDMYARDNQARSVPRPTMYRRNLHSLNTPVLAKTVSTMLGVSRPNRRDSQACTLQHKILARELLHYHREYTRFTLISTNMK